MLDPFTIRDGKLFLDEGQGNKDGPRVIDPVAGLVRFADESQNLPIAELRAVAVVYTQRMVWRYVADVRTLVPTLIHSVMLVPRRIRDDVAALLDALENGRDPGPGFSIRGAAMMVDEVAIQFDMAGTGLAARSTAKAVARLTQLPMVELYGEFYVWRAAGQLDQTLFERLRGAPARAEPGPPPPGLAVREGPSGLELRASPASRPMRPWLILAGALLAVSVGLAFVDLLPAVVCLLLSVGTLAGAAMTRKVPGATLYVEPATFRFEGGTLASDRLEMLRVNDATLVLISHDDELRCDLGTEEAALWARRAIEHFLLARSAGPYR
ncbi:MAG: hypothetical protein L6Q84_26330 [Polyangiaceae bacterium]|nr:hypothetical protein [Polyangiaceae bacterium]